MRDTTLEPYRKWESEQPPDCASQQLRFAEAVAASASAGLKPDEVGFNTVYQSGTWELEVADGAKQHGCYAVARRLYDDVIATYVGTGYASLRERARIGIDDIRHAEAMARSGSSQ